MAPIKFEEHIKDKLREREIKPSSSGWERVSEGLELPAKKKKKSFIWYGVAASLIGLLVISITFFTSKNQTEIKNDTTIVLDNEEKDVKQEIKENVIPLLENKEQENYTVIPKEKSNSHKSPIFSKTLPKEEALVFTDSKNLEPKKVQKIVDTTDKVIEAKLIQIIAQVNNLEENNKTLNDIEVDSLLRIAQNEILKEKIFKNSGKIDAMALLTEAEDELDQSFRDKVFEKLKQGLFKARTAVADRNN